MNATARKRRITYTQIIILSYISVIVVGAALLMLPAAARNGKMTDPLTALFTAVSSTCVTGLIVVDTFMHWTLFGQLVILAMIQIGGLGFMTLISMLFIFAHKHIGLHERRLLMQSSGAPQLRGVVRLVKRICLGTFAVEGAGALVLATQFCPELGFTRGIYNAVFHSVSAFCNAGFDLMGRFKTFSSFTTYVDNPVISITLMALIVIGGLGFIVWADLFKCRFRLRSLELHTKIVLTATAALIFGGAALFFLFERNASLAGLSSGDKLLGAFFQSVTTRTAGFNTVDNAALSNSGSIVASLFMFIGGSPGSTAGGIKTTTAVVLLISVFSSARKNDSDTLFKRRLENGVVRQACAVTMFYLISVLVAATLIAATEPILLREVFFECFSAIGTVGLTMGITPQLGVAARIALMFLMFLGRAGGLTLALAVAEKKAPSQIERPTQKIIIG